MRKSRLSVEEYEEGILSGNRMILSRAITLVESTLASDKALSEELMHRILPHSGNARRIGITGVPGVGKSTFIEAFGKVLLEASDSLAVLTIDPSSSISGGSILGDKTRMEELSMHPNVFIRPTAAGSALGGVAYATREAMLLCEAAGFETILIETVGVGQSEIEVRNMVDFFLLLMLSGAGDELQGIKKGIMEMADLLVITKADGQNIEAAQQARTAYTNALHLFPPAPSGWQTHVLVASAIQETGLSEINQCVDEYYQHMHNTGRLENLRNQQNIQWLHELIKIFQQRWFLQSEGMDEFLRNIEAEVGKGIESPYSAASRLMEFRLK